MNVKTILAVVMTVTSFLVFEARAADAPAAAPAQSHEEHHPADAKTPADSNMMANGGMMGAMDMDQMKGMMHSCMEKQKDGKMCDHEAMQSCQKNMKKEQCSKMMNQAKKEDKSVKK